MRRICEAFINDMQKNCGLHKNAGFSQSVRRRNQKNPGCPHNADAGKQKPAAADAKTGLSQKDV
jgi:hypothetical protein